MAEPKQTQAEAPPRSLERHAQTIIGALILAAILGMANMMFDMRDRMTRAEEKAAAQYQLLIVLRDQLGSASTDRYTATDARREFSEINRRLNTLESARQPGR